MTRNVANELGQGTSAEIKKKKQEKKQQQYNSEVVPVFKDMKDRLAALYKFIFDDNEYALFVKMYIRNSTGGYVVMEGVNPPRRKDIANGNSDGKSKENTLEYYRACTYNYTFWRGLNQQVQKFSIMEGVDEEEFQAIRDKLEVHVNGLKKDRQLIYEKYRDYAERYYSRAIEKYTRIDKEVVRTVVFDKLSRSMNAFVPGSVNFVTYFEHNTSKALRSLNKHGKENSEMMKKFVDLNWFRTDFYRKHGVNSTVLAEAAYFNIDPEDVIEIRKYGSEIYAKHYSTEEPLSQDPNLNLGSTLKSSINSPERIMIVKDMQDKLKNLTKGMKLNDKERVILEERLTVDNVRTLQSIADDFGISKERIRQIEANLLKRLRAQFAKQGIKNIGDIL